MCGHKKPVLDVTWNPFNDNEIASCSEDCTVKLWDIPDEGLKENLAEFKMDMAGHMHKVCSSECVCVQPTSVLFVFFFTALS